MKCVKARWWMGLLLAAAGASACSSPELERQARVYRLAAAAALAGPKQPEPASLPSARSEDATEPVTDPEFVAFDEQLQKSCHVASEPMTTSDMVRAAADLEECAERRSRGLLARLPRAQRVKLLALPRPPDKAPQSWYPAWSSFVATACYLDDAQAYSGANGRTTGTIRSVSLSSCFASASETALYWLQLVAQNDAARFAEHLRRLADNGRRAERQQDALAAHASQLAARAYESGNPDDGCRLCPLGDADFRKLVRVHGSFRQSAIDLAEVTCSSWPSLVEQLGGEQPCLELSRLHWRALGGWGEYDAETWADEAPTVGRRPATKDPDYARFIDPVYGACEHRVTSGDEDIGPCIEAVRRRELVPLRSSRASEVLTFEGDLRAFTTALCPVVGAGASFHYTGSLRGFPEKDCRLLVEAHAAFVAHSWATDDDSAFRRHVAALAQRAKAVEMDLKRLASAAAAEPCTEDAPLGSACHWAELGAPAWARARRGLDRLHPTAGKLASSVCRGWPALLAAVRTEQVSCEQRLAEYFIAYADLGAVIEPAQN